jgi:transcriptional regulator with XRE-family HTH domain
MGDESPPDVGQRVKAIREAQGLSLRALAERSGVAVNTVSLIERGQSSPTVSTLHRLAGALGVRIVDFFGAQEQETVVFMPADARGRTQTGEALIESLGTGLARQRIEPFQVTLKPGAGSGLEPITHGGQEFVLGLDGRVDYAIGGRTYVLKHGDALLFEASLPHAWCNPTWEEARFLLILESDEGGPAPLLPHFEEMG